MISCVVGRTVMTLFITCLGDNLILSIHVLLESHKPALMQDHRNHIVIYHCLLSPVLIGFRFTQNFKAGWSPRLRGSSEPRISAPRRSFSSASEPPRSSLQQVVLAPPRLVLRN